MRWRSAAGRMPSAGTSSPDTRPPGRSTDSASSGPPAAGSRSTSAASRGDPAGHGTPAYAGGTASSAARCRNWAGVVTRRCRGSWARQSSSSRRQPAPSRRSIAYRPRQTSSYCCSGVVPAVMCRPVSIRCALTASAQTSPSWLARQPSTGGRRTPSACSTPWVADSGGQNAIVRASPIPADRVDSSGADTPKSATANRAPIRSTLVGLMSPCTTRRAWMCSSPAATCSNTAAQARSSSRTRAANVGRSSSASSSTSPTWWCGAVLRSNRKLVTRVSTFGWPSTSCVLVASSFIAVSSAGVPQTHLSARGAPPCRSSVSGLAGRTSYTEEKPPSATWRTTRQRESGVSPMISPGSSGTVRAGRAGSRAVPLIVPPPPHTEYSGLVGWCPCRPVRRRARPPAGRSRRPSLRRRPPRRPGRPP